VSCEQIHDHHPGAAVGALLTQLLWASLLKNYMVYERLQELGSLSTARRRALNAVGISVVDVPVLANGHLELRYPLREHAFSQTVHRYGNVLKTYRET